MTNWVVCRKKPLFSGLFWHLGLWVTSLNTHTYVHTNIPKGVAQEVRIHVSA